jgi:hypothetical protein
MRISSKLKTGAKKIDRNCSYWSFVRVVVPLEFVESDRDPTQSNCNCDHVLSTKIPKLFYKLYFGKTPI